MDPLVARGQDIVQKSLSVCTFDAAGQWHREAEEISEGLSELFYASRRKIAALEKAQIQLRADSIERSLFGRFFKSDDEKSNFRELNSFIASAPVLEALIGELRKKIDTTPISKADQASYIKDLKLQKKDVQLQKRELSSSMMEVRTAAKHESIKAGDAWFADRSSIARDRRRIHLAKNNALRPGEEMKAHLDQLLLAIDREILRIERFE